MFKHISTLLLATLLICGLVGVASASTLTPSDKQPAGSATRTGTVALHGSSVNETKGDAEPDTTDGAVGAEETEDAAAVEEVEVPEEQPVATVTSNFYVNGEPIQGMTFDVYGGVLYGSVRGFCEGVLSQAAVAWVNGGAEVLGTTSSGETLALRAQPGLCYLTANDRCLYVQAGVQLKGGVTLAPMEVLISLFPGSTMAWDEGTGTAWVTLGASLLASGGDFYNEQDLSMIARVISSEAGNQPLLGKIAVGNVIMNRVASNRFPNTVYEVLYAKGQFTIVNYAIFQQPPNAESLVAAKLAMEGACVVPGAVYYCRAGLDCWTSRYCPYLTTIADHSFYGV